MMHNHKVNPKFDALSTEQKLKILGGHLARMESGDDPRSDLIECVKYDIEQLTKEQNGTT